VRESELEGESVRQRLRGWACVRECAKGRECMRVSKREGVRESEQEGGSERE